MPVLIFVGLMLAVAGVALIVALFVSFVMWDLSYINPQVWSPLARGIIGVLFGGISFMALQEMLDEYSKALAKAKQALDTYKNQEECYDRNP